METGGRGTLETAGYARRDGAEKGKVTVTVLGRSDGAMHVRGIGEIRIIPPGTSVSTPYNLPSQPSLLLLLVRPPPTTIPFPVS